MKIFIESPLVLPIHLLCDELYYVARMRRPFDGSKNVVSSKGSAGSYACQDQGCLPEEIPTPEWVSGAGFCRVGW